MKIFALTHNELIKQLKGKGTRVILILLLMFAVILPIGFSLIPESSFSNYQTQSNEFYLEEAKNTVTGLENKTSDEDKIKLIIAKGDYEYYLLNNEAKVGFNEKYGYNEWREDVSRDFKRKYIEAEAIRLIMEGIPKDVLMDKIYNVDPSILNKAYESTKAEQEKILAELEAEKEKYRSIVIEEDYLTYLEKNKAFYSEIIASRQKDIETLKKDLDKDPKNEQILAQIDNLEADIAREQAVLAVKQYRYDNKIDFSVTNWKNKTLKTIEDSTYEKYTKPLSEDEYKRQASLEGSTITFDQYKEIYKNNQIELENKINQNWYSLEKNLPQLQYVTDARTVMNTVSNIFMIAAAVVVIILGGGIVSNEFSAGTIRLLLIRPVSRVKVLIAKLLSLLIFGYGIVIVTTLISLVSSGAVYGFETLGIPVLEVINGAITEQTFIMVLVNNMTVASLSLVFVVALVFSLSTLTKNTAVAVALSIVIYLGSMPLTLMIAERFKGIGNTFIPFINQPMLNLSTEAVEMLKTQSGVTFNPGMGLIQLMIIAVVLVVLSFVIFTKKDVKN
ncbi:MAG: ABC transporter permease subunit [Turicibacter sp.]